jgi:hypothetical protein
MMTGEFFVQIWKRDGRWAEKEIQFSDFPSLLSYVVGVKDDPAHKEVILMVHPPSQATDRERQEIRNLGVQLF